DERSIPTGKRSSVESTPYAFRAGRPMGAARLDTAFTDLERDGDGRFTVSLESPDASERVALWADADHRWLMLYTGDTLDEGARRRGLAVEPMSCPPNAFQTGEDVRVLEPD